MAILPTPFTVQEATGDQPPTVTASPSADQFWDEPAMQEENLPETFTEEEIEILNQWTPLNLIGTPSPYLPPTVVNGMEMPGTINSPWDLIAHARGYRAAKKAEQEQAAALVAEKPAASERPSKYDPVELEAYKQAVQNRKETIERLNNEWKDAVHKRKQALEEWDRFVEEKRIAVRNARAAAAPVHPLPRA